MTHPNGNVPEALKSLGLRASPDALAAFFAHATKSRLSPIQTVERLITLERKEREVRNLAHPVRLQNCARVTRGKSSKQANVANASGIRHISLRRCKPDDLGGCRARPYAGPDDLAGGHARPYAVP